MERTQIYLEDGSRRRLQRLAARRKTTMAHVIREAVDQYTAKESGNDALAALERVRGIWADKSDPHAELRELRAGWGRRLRRLGLE